MSSQFGIAGYGYTSQRLNVVGPTTGPIPLPRNPLTNTNLKVLVNNVELPYTDFSVVGANLILNTDLTDSQVAEVIYLDAEAPIGVDVINKVNKVASEFAGLKSNVLSLISGGPVQTVNKQGGQAVLTLSDIRESENESEFSVVAYDGSETGHFKTKLIEAGSNVSIDSSGETLKISAASSDITPIVEGLDALEELVFRNLNYPNFKPILTLDFVNTGKLTSNSTFTRDSDASCFDQSGNIVTVAPNTPRFACDPLTGECQGLLLEEARTRLNLVSANPSTNEVVNLLASEYTISFYGDGTVTLSGAYSGVVVGSGAYPTRKSLTFVSALGNLTIAYSGDVRHVQLEKGSSATSVILGEGSQVSRSADIYSEDISTLFNATQGTLVFEGQSLGGATTSYYVRLGNTTSLTDSMYIFSDISVKASVNNADATKTTTNSIVDGKTFFKSSFGYSSGSQVLSVNGDVVKTITGDLPAVPATTLYLGATDQKGSLIVKRISYYGRRVTNGEAQALSLI